MNEIKAKFNKQKGKVATRLFKMENKSKMYLGILKHWSRGEMVEGVGFFNNSM